MKIAIVKEQVDMRRGGAETSTLEMARHLAALGLDVTVVCSDRHEGTEARRPDGVGFHTILVGSGSRVGRAVHFVAEADRFCREERFDVVHAITPCFSCGIYQPRGGTYVETVNRSVGRARTWIGRLVKRLGRRFNRRQRFLMLIERGMLIDRKPPIVAAVSKYVASQVSTAFPSLPAERIRVVFNGVDFAPLPPEEAQSCRSAIRCEIGIDESTPLVLFVAHNFKLKGLRELIHAFEPQSEPEAQARDGASDEATKRRSDEGPTARRWTLAVVGRDDPTPYRRLARRLGVTDRVHFFGPRTDLPALCAAADVLAHPTWYDPCSRVVLEALCCGLPVVTTRFNGAAEVMERGRHAS